VLGDFDLLHHLTEGSTITGTVFTDDSNLLGTLGLKAEGKQCEDVRGGAGELTILLLFGN
jgi:hypothetical protein